MAQADNDVFLVKVIIPFTGHSNYLIVVAKDKLDAEDFVRDRFRRNPIGDMSAAILLETEMIDRFKEGIVEVDEE